MLCIQTSGWFTTRSLHYIDLCLIQRPTLNPKLCMLVSGRPQLRSVAPVKDWDRPYKARS